MHMNKNSVKQLLGIGVLILVLFLGLSYLSNRNAPAPESVRIETPQTDTISLTIEGLFDHRTVSISEGQTVLGVLKSLDESDPNVHVVTKEYSGLGTLVERIGEKTNGEDNKYWQYTVNGVMPQIGADALELVNGDTLEWHFSESTF